MPKIEKIYAFIIENIPGSEGIVAGKFSEFWLPLVGADKDRIESLKEVAASIATQTGKKILVVEFSVRKVIDTIMPINN